MKAQILSFHCVLKNRFGKIISSTFNQDVYTHGPGDFLKALSKGLENLKAGEKRSIVLSAQQAYGFYDLELVIEIARAKIPQGKNLRIGDEIWMPTKRKQWKSFRVTQADPKFLTLDGNHPLAGQDLIFDVEGVKIRDVSRQELEEIRFEEAASLYH